ncbi:hypothetical protein DFH27DRAFT_314603 [Peziza echinospora]|nr:hypothetical protein DFH27DRAFT_314603 [Peziza echinospora]
MCSASRGLHGPSTKAYQGLSLVSHLITLHLISSHCIRVLLPLHLQFPLAPTPAQLGPWRFPASMHSHPIRAQGQGTRPVNIPQPHKLSMDPIGFTIPTPFFSQRCPPWNRCLHHLNHPVNENKNMCIDALQVIKSPRARFNKYLPKYPVTNMNLKIPPPGRKETLLVNDRFSIFSGLPFNPDYFEGKSTA